MEKRLKSKAHLLLKFGYNLKMKISLILICLIAIAAHANPVYAQRTKISLDFENATLQEVIDEIESKTEFRFIFSTKAVDTQRKVSIAVNGKRIDRILPLLFPEGKISYDIYDRKILLKKNEPEELDRSSNTLPVEVAQLSVNGTVTDQDGVPLPGANIVEKGTANGVTADFDGNFSMEVADGNAILVFSYIGFATKEVAVNGQSTIDIILEESAAGLEEVVVVGYGTQSTRKITGSLQNVKAEELGNAPVATIGQMLQGKLSGVTVQQTTGRPGEGLKIRIRGAASITAGSEPLYVVDGFPITGDMSNISSNQIESISVLKDAAATSLYGSRAANGVVLVQTKQATPGQTKIDFNSYSGMEYVPQGRRLDMMNAREYAQFSKEVAELNGRPVDPAFQNPEQYGEGTDWFDVITKVAPIQNYDLTVGGGTEKFRTTAMVGYFNQDGVVRGTGYQRFSFRINSNFKPYDNLNIGFNVAPSYSTNSNFETDNSRGNIVGGSLLTTPLASPYNPDGSLALTATDPTKSHPNWLRVAKEKVWEGKDKHLLSNAFVEYEIMKGLTAKTSANIELDNSSLFQFNPSTIGNGLNNPPPIIPNGSNNESQYYSWLNENTLSYQTEINGHSIDALMGFTAQGFRTEGNEIIATNYPDDKVHVISAAAQTSVNSDIQEWKLLSALARLNYNYQGKYLLTASIRRDGSSRFGPEKRWGNFPSVSAGWIVSEEDFWNVEPVSFLKLRASYGTVGNFNIGNYTYISTISTTNYAFGNSVSSGRAVDNLGDRGLGWERNKELNIGGDIYLFDDRVQLSYNYYNKRSSDLLYNVQVPLSSGFGNLQTNIGELKFWGHDISIRSANINNNDLSWNTNFNIAVNRNRVLALGTKNEALLGDRHITQVGQPIGMFYGLIFDGFYDTQEELDNSPKHTTSQIGTIKFKDLNDDGIITQADRTIIGSPWPDFTFGMTNNINYKNFDFSVAISGSYGNLIGARHEYTTANLDASYNVLKEVENRWRSPEDHGAGKYGIALQGTTYLERDWWHSRFLRDGSFLSFNNITFGYTIPLNQNATVNRFRIYGSVQNAIIISSYAGPNPEVSTRSGSTALGIDDSAYPLPRTISFGVNIGI